jgi:hypothetical protein
MKERTKPNRALYDDKYDENGDSILHISSELAMHGHRLLDN